MKGSLRLRGFSSSVSVWTTQAHGSSVLLWRGTSQKGVAAELW